MIAVKGSEGRALQGARLLLADDDADFIDYLRGLFISSRVGAVVSALSGTEALEALVERGPFDLVVTDHRMPGPTGAQLVAMVRYAGYSGPILIVTAFPGDDVEAVVERHEGVVLLPKTTPPHQILDAAHRLIVATGDPGR